MRQWREKLERRGRVGHGVGKIGTGWGLMPKGGASVAVLPKVLGTHCSILRKEVPCLVTQLQRRNGLVLEIPPPKIAKGLNKPLILGLEDRAPKMAGKGTSFGLSSLDQKTREGKKEKSGNQVLYLEGIGMLSVK